MAEYYRVARNGQLIRILARNSREADYYLGWVNDQNARGNRDLARPPKGVKIYRAPMHAPIRSSAEAAPSNPRPDLAISRGFEFRAPPPRGIVPRMADGFKRELGRSYINWLARAGTRAMAVDTNFQMALDRDRARASGRPIQRYSQIKAAADRRVTYAENERRDEENRRDAGDPAWRKGGTLFGNSARTVASGLGRAAGSLISDPTILLSPAAKFGLGAFARIGLEQMATRSSLAELERREGIRERSYSPHADGRKISFGESGRQVGVVHVDGKRGRTPDGVNETVAFETILSPELHKRSHSVHKNRCNGYAEAALLDDPQVAAYLNRLIPNARKAMERRGGRLTPRDWVWHHHVQTGRMELIPRWQHDDKAYQKVLHPDRAGGCKIWGPGHRH
jgi:hypothetical protein